VNPKGRPKGMTIEERFWEKVDRTGECWRWTGGRVGSADVESGRYGRFAISTTRGHVVLVLAHRFSWELHFGPVPAGLHVLHACDNPACVNPDHLMVGTHRANRWDASRKGRLVWKPDRKPRSA
jgi:hypothetical protein